MTDPASVVGAPAASIDPRAVDPVDAAPEPPGTVAPWRPPRFWLAMMWVARALAACVCRLRVTGDVPADLRGGPVILAANHIGSFDPVVLAAACGRLRLAPRIMATGGLFRARGVGPLMRRAGHLRVDRRRATVVDAFDVAREALAARSVVLAYPEGRITLDPGMWPERGKTGLARLAIGTGAPVVPVAQWGAHLVLPWGAPRGMWRRVGWSVAHRPVVRVHVGAPLRFGPDASARAVRAANDAIMDAITDALVPLRPGEPRLPGWQDPQRPLSVARTHRHPASRPEAG